MARGEAVEFDERAATDGDLAIARIGERQAPVEIAVKRHAVCAVEGDEPRLGVVRVGRQQRMRERKTPRIAFSRAWIAPSGGGIGQVLAAACRERRGGGKCL